MLIESARQKSGIISDCQLPSSVRAGRDQLPTVSEGSKTTKEATQNSTSNSSQKDCIILEQMNKMNPKLRIIFT
ncbi:hypothetical protein AVEN_67991-1, partial [Araneus ventricosus]